MLEKEPGDRIKLQDIKVHPWVTGHGLYPMMRQESNCCLIEVTDDEVENCVKSIPKLDTLILVKVKLTAINFSLSYPHLPYSGNDKKALICKPLSEYSSKVRQERSIK